MKNDRGMYSSEPKIESPGKSTWYNITIFILGGLLGLISQSFFLLFNSAEIFPAAPKFFIFLFYYLPTVVGYLALPIGLILGVTLSGALLLISSSKKKIISILSLLLFFIIGGGLIIGFWAQSASPKMVIPDNVKDMKSVVEGTKGTGSGICSNDLRQGWYYNEDERLCEQINFLRLKESANLCDVSSLWPKESREECRYIYNLQQEGDLIRGVSCNSDSCNLLLGVWFQDKNYCEQVASEQQRTACYRYIF